MFLFFFLLPYYSFATLPTLFALFYPFSAILFLSFSSMLPQKAYDTYLFKRFFTSANPLNLSLVPASSSND